MNEELLPSATRLEFLEVFSAIKTGFAPGSDGLAMAFCVFFGRTQRRPSRYYIYMFLSAGRVPVYFKLERIIFVSKRYLHSFVVPP